MTAQTHGMPRAAALSDTEMYAAVVDRDDAFDERFVYGVVTTGVYCKPSCGSRLAKRENLRFFPDPASAGLAGFRACKRCRPDGSNEELAKLVDVARFIESHAEERLPLARLASRAKLSPSRLQKAFKAAFGVSPKAYQDAMRLESLKKELKAGEDVTGAIFAAGFGSTSRVYGEPARNLGMTPATYRAGGAGETIFHAYRDSALGPLMMAATARGVCFAQFGSDEESLFRQLQEEFPEATLVESPGEQGPELDAWIDALDRHLDRAAPRPDLPLDLRGTSFQLKVWRFLLRLGEGEVVSYGEVAKGIEQPNAARAVASACGANRIGVLVPCHRVLRGDGGLGGYRWGAERKRTLLDLERRKAPARAE